jgi:hypothetical protein
VNFKPINLTVINYTSKRLMCQKAWRGAIIDHDDQPPGVRSAVDQAFDVLAGSPREI